MIGSSVLPCIFTDFRGFTFLEIILHISNGNMIVDIDGNRLIDTDGNYVEGTE
jgi:hypothetical protein